MSEITKLIWELIQVKAAVIAMLGVIVIGYVIKLSPSVDNRRIPIYTILCSVFIYTATCTPPEGSFVDLPASINYFTTVIILGAFVGMVAWQFHARLLKRFEESIPVIGPLLKEAKQQTNETNK